MQRTSVLMYGYRTWGTGADMMQRTEAEVWLAGCGFRLFNNWRPWDRAQSEVLE